MSGTLRRGSIPPYKICSEETFTQIQKSQLDGFFKFETIRRGKNDKYYSNTPEKFGSFRLQMSHFKFPGCGGYHICLTHRRSPVRNQPERSPFFVYSFRAKPFSGNGLHDSISYREILIAASRKSGYFTPNIRNVMCVIIQ